jgi:hypothetical protein
MLQVRRSWVRFLMRSLDFFNWPNYSSHTMALGSTQPLTEMSTTNLPGGKVWLVREPDNLTVVCEPIVWTMWDPQRLTTLWASLACYRITLRFTFCLILILLFYISYHCRADICICLVERNILFITQLVDRYLRYNMAPQLFEVGHPWCMRRPLKDK